MARESAKARFNRMMDRSSAELNEETRAAAERDFAHVAGEYFDAEGVTITTKRGKTGLEITVSFHASRVKNFNALK